MTFKKNLQLEWKLKEFDDLLPREVYSIIQLRQEIFILEQNTCILYKPEYSGIQKKESRRNESKRAQARN